MCSEPLDGTIHLINDDLQQRRTDYTHSKEVKSNKTL